MSKYDILFSNDEKQKMISEYLNGLSIRDISNKYNIKSKSWINLILLKGVSRNSSESSKLAHKKHPESFKHSDKTKALLSEKRLKYLKEHPEDSAWRKRNKPSYPESVFIEFLNKYGYSNSYYIEREYPVFPYYIDFAFIDIKLAIEIDGSQHEECERKSKDSLKDKTLINNGWKVIRFTEHIVKTDWKILDDSIKNAISCEYDNTVKRVGIYRHKSLGTYVKRERQSNGLTKKQEESHYRNRKVKRPSKEILSKEIINFSFVSLGKKYGVCDKCIVKWCKYYGLPYRKKDIKNIYNSSSILPHATITQNNGQGFGK